MTDDGKYTGETIVFNMGDDMVKDLSPQQKGPVASQHFRFLDLPSELRWRILEFTELIGQHGQTNDDLIQELYIDDFWFLGPQQARILLEACEKCGFLYQDCVCPEWQEIPSNEMFTSVYKHGIPLSLFQVCRSFSNDAMYICYSRNRVVIGDIGIDQQRRCLETLPTKGLHWLRRLDIKVSLGAMLDYRKNKEVRSNWHELIAVIKKHCNLPALHLSFRSGHYKEDVQGLDLANLEWLRAAYASMIRAMKPLRGLKRFHAFFSLWCNSETAAERYIMGPEYLPWEDGKILWSNRPKDDPHRALSEEKYHNNNIPDSTDSDNFYTTDNEEDLNRFFTEKEVWPISVRHLLRTRDENEDWL